MNEQQKYAHFSNAAYSLNNPLHSRAVNQANSIKVLNDAGITGYEIHPSSNHQRGVYINNDKKDIVIAHRGTKPSSFSNLQSDIAIGFGMQGSTNRFKRAVKRDKKIKDAFPNHNITLTGHSLAGSLGSQSSKENDIKGVFYNIGSGVPTLSTLSQHLQPKNNNITHYSVNFDPVSIQSKKYNINQINVKRKNGVNAHSLENFF